MSIQARFKIKQGNFNLDIDLTIPAQGVTALFGPSGCGKTTLLRAIAGLDQYQDGFLKVGAMCWQEGSHFLPPHQRPLAYVFQEANLFDHLTVQANLEYGFKRVPEAERKIPLQQVIELLSIEDLLERKPALLSGGERQRVAIARALAVSPKLLLMDEPLASLDHQRKQEILPYIEALHSELNIPIIYVSHAPDEVARLADHLILLDEGKVIGTGSIADMLTRLDLSLAHRSDAEALIEATVTGHDSEYKLTYLNFAGGQFSVLGKDLALGSKVRLRVTAQDVSLTLQAQSDTSILNIFPASVEELVSAGPAQVTVRLKIGEVFILSRITRKSSQALKLRAGSQVFAQIKSVATLA